MKDGKVIKVNAFPGHNIPLGALGVFILWLGWYGFNGAAATSVPQLGCDIHNNNDCSCRCNSRMYDLYMDQVMVSRMFLCV